MKYFFLSSILLITLSIHAQDDKKLKEADAKFDNFSYVDAREIYLEVAQSGYTSENLLKRLGDSYYFNGELDLALPWYESLYASQKILEREYLFRYAMCLKQQQQYDKAATVWAEYAKDLPKNTLDTLYSKKDYLELLALQSNRFSVENALINSTLSDFSPTFYLSKLVFASNREVTTKKDLLDPWTRKPYYDLYMVDVKRDNSLGIDIQKLPSEINTSYHESSPTFTRDGNTMYFTRNNFNNDTFKENSKGTNLLKIYRSIKDDNGFWQAPVELPFNSDEYACAHPSLSPDEKWLFFSSDMPGTIGQSDLFVVRINTDAGVGKPIHLGSKINTTQREVFPFFSDAGILYFSSEGHYGLGGYDIFMTEFDVERLAAGLIVNMGNPINTSSDDFSLIINDKDHTGYFTSNRKNGSGDDDIYFFKQIQKPITSCKQWIKGYITDSRKHTNIPNAKVTLLNDKLEDVRFTYTDAEGLYQFEVNCNESFVVRVAVSGFDSEENTIHTSKEFEIQHAVNFAVDKGGELGVKTLRNGEDMGEILLLDNIYFDFNKSDIRPDAEIELQKMVFVLKKKPSLKIEVRSHTDSRGDSDYNTKLSNDRAIATRQYILSKGVNADRVTTAGMGDKEIINNCVKDVPCSEEEHALNRRSEFIVLSFDNEIYSERIPKVENVITENTNPLQQKNTIVKSNYDFKSTQIIYTVQIGAFKQKELVFPFDIDVFSHLYQDGLTRCFSGVFKSKEEAIRHKEKLKKMKLDGIVIQLQGESRK